MSITSSIEWTDATWNPMSGCTEVSPGCDHCYAKTFAERWRGVKNHHFENGFDLTLRPDRLSQPLRWKRPRRIFVNSMSDLFHDQISDEFIARVFAVMALAQRHTFQVLTKRHGRMRALLSSRSFPILVAEQGRAHHIGCQEDWLQVAAMMSGHLPNVWLGVSVEDQKRADLRIPALVNTPAAVRWVSCEPLLGPVDLTWSLDRLDWVVAGGESGPGARPMHPQWARSLGDQCTEAGVPFLFKQWGAWVGYTQPGVSPWDGRDPDGWVHYDTGAVLDEEAALAAGGSFMGMFKVGKRAAGRVLDGRTWDEFPAG